VFEEKAKQGTSKKQAASGSSKFFPNGSWLLLDYTVLCPRK
jgi:hypothetical protein